MNSILVMVSKQDISESHIQEIQRLAPDRNVIVSDNPTEIAPLMDEVEIATGWVPRDVLSGLKNLRWFQQWGAGADWLFKYPEYMEKDFILTNVSGLHAIPISEHIISLVLALGRDLSKAIQAQAKREWTGHEDFKVFELPGKTMVLVGVGAIGERTAEIATSLGMRVFGIRRNPDRPANGVEAIFAPSQLPELLPHADFLVITAPLTSETRGIIGDPELRAMPSSAYIINIGRGGIIDESALVHALKDGWIAGAGLDVFENEPLLPDSPLWDMDNVIITPHYAGKTPYYAARAIEIFINNLQRYQAEEPMVNLVDKALGY
jgi:phosphoglycerate dehydrogenase-like enzyme